jgi:pimeloyl-ACP methyl ester carboxylesterase
MLAITSSPISWTPEGFSIIGYSLGGGIAADFAAYFPDLIQGLALLAPAGLIRPYHFGWQSKILYNDFLPTSVLEYLIGRRLGGGDKKQNSVQKLTKTQASSPTADVGNVAAAEAKGMKEVDFHDTALDKRRPNVTVASAVNWQMRFHEGFVRSFVSSIRFASISGNRETWMRLRGLKVPVLVVAGIRDDIM